LLYDSWPTGGHRGSPPISERHGAYAAHATHEYHQNLLKANIAKADDPSTNREYLKRIHAQQDVLLAQVHNINTQLEAIGRERSERGVRRLGIFREYMRHLSEIRL